MTELEISLMEENRKLKDQVEHLKKCKEFESDLQMKVLSKALEFMQFPKGSTVTVSMAWKEIEKALDKKIDEKGYRNFLVAYEEFVEGFYLLKNRIVSARDPEGVLEKVMEYIEKEQVSLSRVRFYEIGEQHRIQLYLESQKGG